jgi:hypothetical protein
MESPASATWPQSNRKLQEVLKSLQLAAKSLLKLFSALASIYKDAAIAFTKLLQRCRKSLKQMQTSQRGKYRTGIYSVPRNLPRRYN